MQMQTFTQRSVISLTRGIYPFFDRLFPIRNELVHGDWIANKTGHISYRAQVNPLDDGSWEMAVLCRSGWHSGEYRYEWCCIGQQIRSSRCQAFREASRLAEQLALFRYRYH